MHAHAVYVRQNLALWSGEDVMVLLCDHARMCRFVFFKVGCAWVRMCMARWCCTCVRVRVRVRARARVRVHVRAHVRIRVRARVCV